MNRFVMAVLLAWVGGTGLSEADAQPVTTIYSFTHGPANPHAGLTLGNDGNFYGTTEAGGPNNDGTLFKVNTNGTMTTIVNFNGYGNGSEPAGNLILGPDGNFYGTTITGGTTATGNNDTGTVFRMTTNGTVTVLVNFNGTNGGGPHAGLALGPDGNFYGTTTYGGSNGDGTVFQMMTNGTLTTLVNFNVTNGANPFASLAAGPGGNLYGTTANGGSNNDGTVFQMTTNGTLTTLFNFAGTNGAQPYGPVTVGPDGNLYGTTLGGTYPNGAFDGGTVFELTTNGMLTTLVRLSGFFGSIYGTSNGVDPYDGLTLGPDGNFYGTASAGGTNGNGTVFQVSTNGTLAMLARIPGITVQTYYNSFGVEFYSTNGGTNIAEVFNGTLTTLYSFSALTNGLNPDGAQPQDSLALGTDGQFYGTASAGGSNDYGTTFKITTNGTFTALASFSGNNGDNPMDALITGPNGNLYGTANSGGSLAYGTAFKLTLGGAITTLVNFDRANDGANPQSSLIVGPGGDFYGTAAGGGNNLVYIGNNTYDAVSDGTAFELTTNGIFTTLIDFSGTNGANPFGGLAVGNDGNLYGTATYGGISNDGTIFQLLTNGTLITLTNFTGLNGANPFDSLILGSDGNFYGTCEAGGVSNDGTVFQVTTNGLLTTLVNFNGTNGANPNDGLIQGPDGNFYGTTWDGGPGNYGTVFKITSGGTLTTLATFAGTNGEFPVGGLALGPDGNFYGTTETGGVSANAGTVFKMTTNGTLTTLYSFVFIPFSSTNSNGTYPFAGLTLATNGNFVHFYGTTYEGGSGGGGTVFQLNLITAAAVAENSTNTFSPLTNEQVWAIGGTLGLVSAVATNGTAQVIGTNIVFAPAANFTGLATINYTVTDNAGGTNYSVINVLVTNIPPVANPDFYSVAENSSANVFSPLMNDVVNTTGGMLGLVSVSPTNGTAGISGTNVLFTPSANFTGTAMIGYTITDNIGGTSRSLITVLVTNVPPVAYPQSVAVEENVAQNITLTGNDPNGLPLTFAIVNGPANGTLSGLNVNTGAVTYTPGTNYVGPDSFTFNVNNGQNTSPPATVSIDVTNAAVTGADLSLTATGPAVPVQVGSNLVYTLTISNAGPATATGVIVSNQIPANLAFVSATGGATPVNSNLLLNLGTLAVGATDLVQIVEQPTLQFLGSSPSSGGQLTNGFQVFGNQTDPNPANNSATVISSVYALIPGTPLTITGSNPGGSLIGTSGFAFGSGPIEEGIPEGFQTLTATPGDIIVLSNPAGGNNPTNWAAVVRYFNPNDLTGTNGTAATDSQAFFPTNFGGSGFTGFQLFPNTDFVPASSIATSNGITTIMTTIEESGPAGIIPSGQVDSNVLTIVSPFTDVSLSASVAPEPVGVGSNLIYTLTVSNAFTQYAPQTVTASDVVISNQIPAGVNFVSATGGAIPVNGILLVNLGSLAEGTNVSVQIVVQPSAPGSLTNAFQVFADQVDPDSTNNTAAVISTVTNAPAVVLADLSLSASAMPQPVIVGSNLVYSLTISNAGPDAATGVLLSNQLPANVNFVSATGGATPSDGILLLNLGTLVPGATNLLQIIVQPTSAGTLTNNFEVFANETDPDPTNNSTAAISTVTNAPVLADLSLAASVMPQPVILGSNLIYSLIISNAGPDAATGVLVSNQLPANVNFVSATGGATPSGGILLLNLGTLAPGATNLLQIIVQPTSTGTVTNKFAVFANEADPDPANNSAAVISTVNPQILADVILSASVAPQPVIVGSNLIYSLTISNAGPDAATGVLVSNQLPAGINFISATGGATPSDGVLLLNLGSLALGATDAVQIIVQPTSAGKLTNVFQVFANETDPAPANNSVAVITTVTNAPVLADVGLSAIAVPQSIGVGSNLIYSLTISNAGPDAATGVVVSNQIPNGVTFISATGGATPSDGVLLLNLGSLALDTTDAVQIIVQPASAGKLTNVFQVFASQADPNPANNSATVISTVTNPPPPQVDVALSLVAAPNPVAVGAPLTYSLTVTNNSATTATGVVVTNTLPPNVSLFSLLPGEGTATNNDGVVTFTVGSLPNGSAATLAIVVLPESAGQLTNVAAAYSTQTDSQPANNRVTNLTTAVTVPLTNLVLTVLSSITLDPQTGLFEQRIEVSNGGPATPSSVMVLISGLATNVTVYDATGITNGLPFVESSSPLGVGSNVVFLLEYYVPTRIAPTNLTFTVEPGPAVTPPVVTGTILSITRAIVLDNGSILVEFSAIPGRVYAIQYSSDMVTWLTAVPVITAPANQVQWIDSGPPQTVSNPAQQPVRYYRVVLLSPK